MRKADREIKSREEMIEILTIEQLHIIYQKYNKNNILKGMI